MQCGLGVGSDKAIGSAAYRGPRAGLIVDVIPGSGGRRSAENKRELTNVKSADTNNRNINH